MNASDPLQPLQPTARSPGERLFPTLTDVARIAARAVIIATGAEYRKPPIENLSQFEGAGVYYGATPMEAQLWRRRGGR